MSIKIIKNGTEWTVREGYEGTVNRFSADNPFSGLNGKNYTLVKENRVRSVISMPVSEIGDSGIHIKYFKRDGYKDYIKHLFVPTKARTEWEVGNALLNEGINTALPLALSEGKRSLLLITETVTRSEDLMEYCQANYEGNITVEKESEKRVLLDKLAAFIRDVHEKGFCHYDLHAGNILIRFKEEQNLSDYDLYLMDLHCVKIIKSISISKRIFNLAQIFNSLSSIMTKVDKLDFIRSYGTDALISGRNTTSQYHKDNHPTAPPSQGGDLKKYISAKPSSPSLQGGGPKKHNSTTVSSLSLQSGPKKHDTARISSPPYEGGERGVVVKYNRIRPGIEQSLVRQIDAQSSGMRNTHYRSRMKRCLKESSAFSKKKVAGMNMFFRKDYDIGSYQELIEKHNSVLDNNDKAIIMKLDSKTALTRHTLKDKTVRNVVVKQYKVGCPGSVLKNIFRGPAGRKAWIAGNGLRVYGFDTPLPQALIEKKVLGIPTSSYLIMEEVKDSLEMDRYILKNLYNRKDLKKKMAFINDFATTLGMMHNHNIFHHDLKTCNIMVKEKDGSYNFTFLDFDKVSFEKKITVRMRVKNLIQINLSTPRLFTVADRIRFMKEYLKCCNIMDKSSDIVSDVVNLSKEEKILYVSLQGDVTEDW